MRGGVHASASVIMLLALPATGCSKSIGAGPVAGAAGADASGDVGAGNVDRTDTSGGTSGAQVVGAAGGDSAGGPAITGGVGGAGGASSVEAGGGTGGTASDGEVIVDGTSEHAAINACDAPDAQGLREPQPGETCYEFRVHGNASLDDTGPFTILQQEHYVEFFYDVPWPASTVATRIATELDSQMPYQWWAFDTNDLQPGGTVDESHVWLLSGRDATLLASWAIGGCAIEMPDGVGLVLPDPGRKLVFEWHHYNYTGTEHEDASVVQVCTRPASEVAEVADATWLGGEQLELPPNATTDVRSTCRNDSDDPVTILMLQPLMRDRGVSTRAEVQRAAETSWTSVFDEPFAPEAHVHYTLSPPVVLQPRDTIRTVCTFRNASQGMVGFGPSRINEACTQIAYAYPAHALANDALSLYGAHNTCWQFGE